ncbi:MAG: Maf family protein [Candidatus Wenzhouxiangella sp. M2_3B_020]
MPSPPYLILASSSPYRAAMLERLGVPFTAVTSGIDETAEPGETPESLARRLAVAKAEHVATEHIDAIVLGADQVASVNGEILGKPGGRDRAIEQLGRMSGNEVVFLSAVALLGQDRREVDVVPTRLRFRDLGDGEITRYVDHDEPFDCAGAMRSEAGGIALLESMSSDDPTAIIGMPLIRISKWLREVGYQVP